MSSFDVAREHLPAERLDLIFRQSSAAHSEPPDEAVLIHAVLLFKANKKHSSEFSEKCFLIFILDYQSVPIAPCHTCIAIAPVRISAPQDSRVGLLTTWRLPSFHTEYMM